MKFKEIAGRLTGLSVPVFGIAWNPPEAERAKAKRIIAHLEDRRVRYRPEALEIPSHCVHSVIQIRHFV